MRKLMVEFADELEWTFVMAGLERDLLEGRRPGGAGMPAEQLVGRTGEWLRIAADDGPAARSAAVVREPADLLPAGLPGASRRLRGCRPTAATRYLRAGARGG